MRNGSRHIGQSLANVTPERLFQQAWVGSRPAAGIRVGGLPLYSQTGNFNEGLHALRGLAAVSVVYFHAALMPPVADVGSLTIVREFGAGVTLFFLLSGFSLTLSNLNLTNEEGWVKGYYVKRIFRIMPLWWLLVIVTLTYHYVKFGKTYQIGEIARNVVPLFGFAPGHHESIVWAGWTIGVEVIFYTVFPLLIIMLGGSIIRWLAAVAVTALISISFSAGLPPGTPESYTYMAFPRQLFVFCLGSLLCVSLMKVDEKGARILRFCATIAFIMGVTLWASSHINPSRVLPLDSLVFKAIVLGLLVVAVAAPKSALSNRLTNFWGDASYGIYLLHPIIVHETKPILFWLSTNIRSPEVAFLAYGTLVLMLTSVIAGLVHQFFESPIYAAGRRLTRKPVEPLGYELATPSAKANV